MAQRLYRRPLRQLESRGTVQIAALVDPVQQHLESMARAFPSASRHRELASALGATQPELALILTPAHLHADQALLVFEAGGHALCEKPMAIRAADCVRMREAAARCSRTLAVGMIRRFFPAFAQLRHLLEHGCIGSIVSFEYREGHKFDWDVTTPAAFRPRADGGTGVLFDIGPHVVDHLAWTVGPLTVERYGDDAMAGVEANALIEVRTPTAQGSVQLSWDSPLANELRVLGTEGEAVLRVDQFDQLAIRRGGTFERQTISVQFPADIEAPPRRFLSPRSYGQAAYCQLIQTIRAILHGEPPAADGVAGEQTVSVLESALAMAQPMTMPWLSDTEEAAFADLHWKRA